VRLWEVATGRCPRVLEGHSSSVLSVAWSRDDRHALSAAVNGVWREWDLSDFVVTGRVPEGDTLPKAGTAVEQQVEYTNAKVLVVGDKRATVA
jgi:WD40 repeat protein